VAASKSKKSDKKAKLAGEAETASNDAYAAVDPPSKSKPKHVDYAAINAPPPKQEYSHLDKPDDGKPSSLGIGVGVGFTQFQSLSFVTYGGEVLYRPLTNVAFVGGAHAYSVHRTLPADL